jgi:guanylate kinase
MTKCTKGNLVIISGPSGVGKSTICNIVVERLDNVYLSISTTTRPKAENEVDGKEYYFITREQFEAKIEEDAFLEHAEVFGNLYGTLKENVDKALDEGKTIILEIDVQGAIQIKEQCPNAIMIFILPPTQKDLVDRMNGRGREDEETAKVRLEEAGNEIAAAWRYYDNMVINDDLEQAVNEVIQIIENERQDKE